MNKEIIKKTIIALRGEQDRLWEKYDNHNIHISLSIEAITGEVMEVIPHSLDLRTANFFGRDLIDGKYKTVELWERNHD